METYNKSVLTMADYSLFTEYTKEESIKIGLRKGKREGRIEGKREGRIEGKIEGKIEGIEIMIVSSFKDDLPVDRIAHIAGMSQDEIISILRKHKLML